MIIRTISSTMTTNSIIFLVLISSIAVNGFVVSPHGAVGARTKGNSASISELGALDIATAASSFETFYQTQPYAAAFVTCSIKASAADLVVQSQEEDIPEQQAPEGLVAKMTEFLNAAPVVVAQETSSDIDLQRNVAFWLYGGIYQGCVQEFLFNTVFPSVFGDSHAWNVVLEQVLLDMTVLTPFLCLPVAYIVKAAINEDENLVDGLLKYVKHVQDEGLLFKYWSLWFPVQCLTFGVVPHHLRIPFIAFVSFFWLMILSNVSAKDTVTTTVDPRSIQE